MTHSSCTKASTVNQSFLFLFFSPFNVLTILTVLIKLLSYYRDNNIIIIICKTKINTQILHFLSKHTSVNQSIIKLIII